MVRLTPYLSFKNQAAEALEFYRSVLGGELDLSRFGDMPADSGMPIEDADKDLLMHGQLDTPSGLTLMAADTGSMMPYVAPTSGVTVALTGGHEDYDYVASAYAKLAEGGTDAMPFDKAPWGDFYGQVTDRYGITWMFDVGAP
ncbi:VOC family protein [Krasilnikoviella flava]|uniref:PhnB protein n=1 Tax=Krasilnikoviella flava TaxID=526729 RepID=A0A1T5ILF3_9MICO|nr:VOC family protein [Krasilnikoviella flava]SKC39940.1 PhnB protein [Krasilnikoviella flava]